MWEKSEKKVTVTLKRARTAPNPALIPPGNLGPPRFTLHQTASGGAEWQRSQQNIRRIVNTANRDPLGIKDWVSASETDPLQKGKSKKTKKGRKGVRK